MCHLFFLSIFIIFIYFYQRILAQRGLYMCTVKMSHHLTYLFSPIHPKSNLDSHWLIHFLKNSINDELSTFHKFLCRYHLLLLRFLRWILHYFYWFWHFCDGFFCRDQVYGIIYSGLELGSYSISYFQWLSIKSSFLFHSFLFGKFFSPHQNLNSVRGNAAEISQWTNGPEN